MHSFPVPPPLLVAEGVGKRYGTNVVLRGVNLAVTEAEVVGIIGPSGSGKTTLLRCLALLEPVDQGRILLDGRDLDVKASRPGNRAGRHLRGEIGLVFQHFNLWPHMTVLGNLIEAPMRVLRLSHPEAVLQADALLARIGLVDRRDAYPSRLSSGQQQRVAIARALCMRPRVLLLDEPTSALDPELRQEVLGVVRQLARDGVTMVVVTHEMSFARRICDRVAFMDAGELVETGAAQAFFDAPQTERARRFLAGLIE